MTRHSASTSSFWLSWLSLLAVLLLWARCDTVAPEEEARLVVEAFIDASQPLPSVRLWQTRPLSASYAFDATTAITDAEVALRIGSEVVAYRPQEGRPGWYEPAEAPGRPAPPRAAFRLEATWQGQQAIAEGTVPPVLRLDRVQVEVPSAPVSGIILDSLFIDPAQLDSLQLDSLKTGAEEGLVYLVEVAMWWSVGFDETGADSAYWIRMQLKPVLRTRPVFDDFFFRPEQILQERTIARDEAGRLVLTGVYAVPVKDSSEALPPHPLRIAVIRSYRDYARYVSSRRDPERREPVSNVQGAIGIVAGLSIDSVWIQVE